MWQRIRRKYLVGIVLLSIAYPMSFVPALYYLLHYAEPTTASLLSFQSLYRMPLKVLPTSSMAALIHAGGYPRPQAAKFAARLTNFEFRLY